MLFQKPYRFPILLIISLVILLGIFLSSSSPTGPKNVSAQCGSGYPACVGDCQACWLNPDCSVDWNQCSYNTSCGNCSPDNCTATGKTAGAECNRQPGAPNFCCSNIGGSGVCNREEIIGWNGDCSACDQWIGYNLTAVEHPCSWLSGCSGCSTPQWCGDGYCNNGETYSSCPQECPAPAPTKTCDLTEERNECCGDGLSLHVKKYEWSDGSGVCNWDIGPCNQPEGTCNPPSGGACDQNCGQGVCGYRNSDGSCTVDNSCCHRQCNGSSCETVAGGGDNTCNPSPNTCIGGGTPYTIQGFKVLMPNNQHNTPTTIALGIDSQQVYLDGGSYKTDNSYSFPNLTSSHTVSVPPLPGYTIGYTLCYDSINCHASAPTISNSVTVTNQGTLADLYWHYTPALPPTPTISNMSCLPANEYNKNGFTISWGSTTPGISVVDISGPFALSDTCTTGSFSSWFYKGINSGDTSTTAPAGFLNISGSLTFDADKKYCVRLWNGTSHSNPATLDTQALCPDCPETVAACGDGNNPPNAASIGACSGTWENEFNPDYNAWCKYKTNSARPVCYHCTTSTTTPWIQVTGDVHSNTGINAPGGP